MRRRHLVIVRAGDTSLHPEWLKGDCERNWDLVVSYFGDQPSLYARSDVVRIDSKGPKWPALHDLIAANPQFISNYAYIWLPDDDLLTTKADINRLFDLCARYSLEAAQPTLTWDSYYSHLGTLRNAQTMMRFTNYIEIMAPCCSSRMLRKALPLLNVNLSGWGLDFAWPLLADDAENGIAMIDEVAVRHTRPIGGPNYKALQERGISPWEEMHAFCEGQGLGREPVKTTHRAIRSDGRLSDAAGKPHRFTLSFVLGFVPALLYTHDPRHLARLLIRMIWNGVCNIPDRIHEA